ncbi:MAG: hypothetical protein UY56_C0005G0048 [Parcubacteria group bacterium GW2011_GWA1_50_14]|uniref:Phage-Barnase-EndoU-ColicinE5/D-RelE like nuclease 2 domain-containing protein n=1 Tax=Candidatus Liptonbacteria bacterium GWB1_49_6 TaxID=1798644 RepID=A0A1G2C4Z3_9BACT|nr:MAG: hypothetical protein UY56_C0005G0048 [Parcubacteria group bacterium GW2011_GWA1_50_14]OGY96485.1 MAG: hypothetical protein A2122_02195 [Candidatus Liptonbacteria bacterium GWB1_49_6]
MSQKPKWISPIIELTSFNGDAVKYLDHLFSIFKKDFIDKPCKLDGKVIVFDKRLLNGKPEGFWHVTSSLDKRTKQRTPDMRRCERLPWIKGIIENQHDTVVLSWRNDRDGEKRLLLFLESEDFLVVLGEKKTVFILITAIYVDNPAQKAKLLKEYKAKAAPVN